MESFKIGALSDTHIPDRTSGLEPEFLAEVKAQKPDLIFHAGDVSVKSVLAELESIAPVLAVRGNRDFMLRRQIPMVQMVEKFGVKIALMHGHMGFFTYWIDKIQYIAKGYEINRYTSRLPDAAPEATVFVFGHTHHAENFWQDGKLFFNPGSITYGDYLCKQRSWGILEVFDNGEVKGKIMNYKSSEIQSGK